MLALRPLVMLLGVALFCGLGHAPPASAHARFKLDGMFKPRTNDTGLKTAPCGGAARTATPVILAPGQTVTVEWEETVDHPGFFRLSFAPADDIGFESNILVDNIPDTQNDGVLPHFYSASVTLPNQACTACTLQLIQVMTENPAAPTNYYSCSDIQLSAGPVATNPVTNFSARAGDRQATLTWQNPAANFAGVLLLQDSQPIVALPVDGRTYQVGERIGTAVVLLAGAATSYQATGLNNGAIYYFSAMAYSPQRAYAAAQTTQVTLTQAPVNAPPAVTLEVTQGGAPKPTLSTTGGNVVVRARVIDPNPGDRSTLDWSQSDSRLSDLDGASETFTFDPRALSTGAYALSVTATDSGIPPHMTTAAALVSVAAPDIVAPVTLPPARAAPTTGPATDAVVKTGSVDLWFFALLLGGGRAARQIYGRMNGY